VVAVGQKEVTKLSAQVAKLKTEKQKKKDAGKEGGSSVTRAAPAARGSGGRGRT